MHKFERRKMLEIKEVSDLDIAFSSNVDHLLPAWDDIPEEFKRGRTKWNKIISDWFFSGLTNSKWHSKEGVDSDKAMRMVQACLRSWEPKHEHKEAGCAYMLSEWFEDVEYERAK